MSEFDDEILAIRAIYGDEVLQVTSEPNLYILSLSSHGVSLRIRFPADYPSSPPSIEGTESVAPNCSIGHGAFVVDVARSTLDAVWLEGNVVLYDLIGQLENIISEAPELQSEPMDGPKAGDANGAAANGPEQAAQAQSGVSTSVDFRSFPDPAWYASLITVEKKSIFSAHACTVSSPAHARASVARLLDSDRRIAKATHNIRAYRIRTPAQPDTPQAKEVVFQDCDDDGETAAGGRLLHLLQVMDVWNVLVVVSRWYGGVNLGPDRFRIINGVAREVLVKGGWAVAGGGKDGKGGKKGA
ncbi:eIF2 kinase Gcn2p negative regulator [Ptychographa xylographoides]|nr:eIF2 kinase Gcn2p negative regulator [Ptychographa xylographoides]